jgi:hypothetical protein
VEWFTFRKDHYRFELGAGDAWVLSDEERKSVDEESQRIRKTLVDQVSNQPRSNDDTDWI